MTFYIKLNYFQRIIYMHIRRGKCVSEYKPLKFDLPLSLILVSSFISLVFFFFSYARHQLFQSSYDLTLFDQWIWLISQGVNPISSITNWHVLSDHAAWALYLFAPIYKIHPNINWLFLSQAICLVFTSIPIWILSINSGLNSRTSWIMCFIWWMQPVIFNVNISDFHPEVWSMPALAGAYLFCRNNNFYMWILCLLFMIGCRDGMILIVFGIFIENLLRRKWKYAATALSLSLGWLIFIKSFLFPYLKEISNGVGGPTESYMETFSSFYFNPIQSILDINYIASLEYLLLLSIAFLPFWKIQSFLTLSSGIPLVVINLISNNPSLRMLTHQYSLPLACIGVIAVIDTLSINKVSRISWKLFTWVSLCWFILAKPYFFTGPYLSRLSSVSSINNAISLISTHARVLTTSYIAPHLSHRQHIDFPRAIRAINTKNYLRDNDVLLLNPRDPGWGSNVETQNLILQKALQKKWNCKTYINGLQLCKKPSR